MLWVSDGVLYTLGETSIISTFSNPVGLITPLSVLYQVTAGLDALQKNLDALIAADARMRAELRKKKGGIGFGEAPNGSRRELKFSAVC